MMKLCIICTFLFAALQVVLFLPVFAATVPSKRSKTGIITAGDIVIGGLIPVHFSPNFAPHPGNSSCRGDFHLRGYKGVEAMLYAVRLINSDPTLLPNVTLGVDIKDTCGSVDYAIMESLSFDFIRSAYVASDLIECGESEGTPAEDKDMLRRTQTKNAPTSNSSSTRDINVSGLFY